MANLSRIQKIDNIQIALNLVVSPKGHDEFETHLTRTSLIGPHLTIKTPHYVGTVTASFESPVITFEVLGIKQRYADTAAFVEAFQRTLEPSRPATNTLTSLIPESTRMGNSVAFERRGTVYLCVEQDGLFEVRYNNQKMVVSHDDIVALFV